jgi:hypothetical protein
MKNPEEVKRRLESAAKVLLEHPDIWERLKQKPLDPDAMLKDPYFMKQASEAVDKIMAATTDEERKRATLEFLARMMDREIEIEKNIQ